MRDLRGVFFRAGVALLWGLLLWGCSLGTDISVLRERVTGDARAGSFTVTFNSNGGSSVPDQTVALGGTATRPANPARSGYAFDNWYSNADLTAVYDFSAAVTGNITLYAKWNAVPLGSFTVTFDSNGGSAVSSQVVALDDTVIPAISARDGYTLDGWYKESTLTTKWNFDTDKVMVNLTLYAKWNENAPGTVTITFDTCGGSWVNPQNIPIGGNVYQPVTPTRRGYIFDNWYIDADYTTYFNFLSPVSTNRIVYAKWTPITYTVTYDKNVDDAGGTMTNSSHTYDVEKALNANAFTRVIYTFVGWAEIPEGMAKYADGENVKNLSAVAGAAVTLYAKWALNQYAVTFNANGGTPIPVQQTIDHGGKVTEPAVMTRTGYTFGGWFKENTFTNQWDFVMDTVTAPTALYAKWTLNKYSVTFNANGGTPAPSVQTIDHGSKVSEPSAMTRTGYTFGGWFKEAMLTNQWNFASDIVTVDITLYAKWNPITYYVAYDANGGTGTMTNSSHTYDIDKILNANVFTRTGYTFTGWGTFAEGPVVYTDQQSVSNLTTTAEITVILYANWTGSGVINVPFIGPTEKNISITRVIADNLSKNGGGSITLTINESFDQYEWFVGTTNVASGNNVILYASNAAFITGHNWITAVVYTGTGANAIPWSGEFVVHVSE